ncbi:LPS export ABC transporter permease LptG [Roseateles saccharophilus]|uniref:Lipopolysaccharide export system permease protein n=1 Tax=Roseateles saccharophilus TaxID=304 RepID=A0A4R3UID5_ROSSA|nr:LPS export ABC transporter permease LptG [Roseateles saccharophilus]MDG0834928.1 LPS export ABC transporter permease LptG [Roseateles saccharophilus]TCU88342.1 lipopolysaccharide export system permease protein [Roseateles saccharophilus]
MRTVRSLLYKDIVGSVVLVALAFLSLFFFIDFVDELERMARVGAGGAKAALLAAMELPGHFYELFPIAVLIGAIVALARLAQSSEFTILRTGGLGPARALALLAGLAAVFAVLTFAVGDYVAPQFEREGDDMRALFSHDANPARRGAWLKDHRKVDGLDRSYSVRVGRVGSGGELEDVRIYEFDTEGRLLSRTEAGKVDVDGQGLWHLQAVKRTIWNPGAAAAAGTVGNVVVSEQQLDRLDWQSSLHAGVIAAAVLPASSMSTLELLRYTEHLSAQEQSSQAYSIQFWRKAFYPLACFVMVALALPFAYLHGRSGGISIKVFGGIMLGISFMLLNNVAGHLGLLKNWTPWLVAATPSLLYLGLSMAAFAWLVRYR